MGKYIKIALVLVVIAGFLLISIPTSLVSMMTAILGGGEEEMSVEEETEIEYISMLLSAEVEQYRKKVLEQAKKEGTAEYIELFLAVMQQESGGNGKDVFQASESKGLPPNSLSVDESIKQGVKYLSAMLKRAKCSSPKDLAGIALALQGYNFGGAYIDYALEKDGYWTQENTFEYAKEKSGGVRNTGSRAEVLGPWKYGDQYYTKHVLRYYSLKETDNSDPTLVSTEKRMSWMFPEKTPTSAEEMQGYLTQVEVPIYTKKGKKSTMTLTVHKKLASEIKSIFKEMQDAEFPISPKCTAGYTWRAMASGSDNMSYHSYGCAIDINWLHNGASYTSWPYKPGKDKLSVTNKIVKIWKDHGFYWGGDWSDDYFDPMHFCYVNH